MNRAATKIERVEQMGFGRQYYKAICHCPFHPRTRKMSPSLVARSFDDRFECMECGAKGAVLKREKDVLFLQRDA